MNIDSLKYFTMVCECGSVTTAAERCSISPSSVSKHIRSLEKELGVSLFVRKHRSIFLTTEGKAVLNHAKVILQECGSLQEELRKINNTNQSVLNLSLLGYTTHYGLWPIIMNYFFKNFGFTNTIKIQAGDIIRQRILSGENVIGICYDEGLDDTIFKKIRLTSDYLALVIPSSHTLYPKDSISIFDIEPYKLGMMTEDTQMARIYQGVFREKKITPQIAYREFFPESLYRFCLINNYLFPFFYHASATYIPDDIRVVTFEEKLAIDIVMVYDKNRKLGKVEKNFVDYIAANTEYLLQADDDLLEKHNRVILDDEFFGVGSRFRFT